MNNIKLNIAGDIVSVHIPRQDRHGTDDRHLYCLVLRKPHPDRHALLLHTDYWTGIILLVSCYEFQTR